MNFSEQLILVLKKEAEVKSLYEYALNEDHLKTIKSLQDE